jgi:hypothetical protein
MPHPKVGHYQLPPSPDTIYADALVSLRFMLLAVLRLLADHGRRHWQPDFRLRHVCRDFLPCLADHGPMVLGVAACVA